MVRALHFSAHVKREVWPPCRARHTADTLNQNLFFTRAASSSQQKQAVKFKYFFKYYFNHFSKCVVLKEKAEATRGSYSQSSKPSVGYNCVDTITEH